LFRVFFHVFDLQMSGKGEVGAQERKLCVTRGGRSVPLAICKQADYLHAC